MLKNSPPLIKVAVRLKCGEAQQFQVQHESVRNVSHARELFKNELPDAVVILALVPPSQPPEIQEAA